MSIVLDLIGKYKNLDLDLEKIVKVVKYLHKYGYLLQIPREQAVEQILTNITLKDIIDAIQKFQEFVGINIGELDAKTMRLMDAPRCAMPDIMEARREAAKWNKNQLLYFVESYVDDLPTETSKTIMADAWNEWEKVANIKVDQTTSRNKANIICSVGTGRNDNFDGPNGTLAWAYLPDGRDSQLLMKFDLSETWTENSTQRGILLKNVACHEFGHLLGLEHSRVQSALMAPYYAPGISKPQNNDDVSRIQKLYGKPVATPTPDPTPDPTPTPNPTTEKVTLVVTGKDLDIKYWKD